MNAVQQASYPIRQGLCVVMCGGMLLGYAVGMVSCAEEERWYVSVHFMSEGYVYEVVHYNPGDYVYIEAHTPSVFDFPEVVELVVTTDEGDLEVLTAMPVEDPIMSDCYVHRVNIKMVAPEKAVMYSNFIEAHIGTKIIVGYSTSEDTAVDTAYVMSAF